MSQTIEELQRSVDRAQAKIDEARKQVVASVTKDCSCKEGWVDYADAVGRCETCWDRMVDIIADLRAQNKRLSAVSSEYLYPSRRH
jgi:hypothetical protein